MCASVCVLLTFNSSVTHFGHSIDPVLPTVRLCVHVCERFMCLRKYKRGQEVCVCVLGEGLEFSYYFSPALLWAFGAINIPQHAKNVQQCKLCVCVCVCILAPRFQNYMDKTVEVGFCLFFVSFNGALTYAFIR